MQDGQNLFSDELTFGREWQVDEQMARLSALGLEAIIAGIPNAAEQRMAEYSPFCGAEGNPGRGDQYLQFLFDDVMPLIQSQFRVTHTRETTGIMGSSLGALISLYAFFQHPERFGFVGGRSPALWFNDCALLELIERGPFVEGRVYVDMGTAEGGNHLTHVQQLHQQLLGKGYRPGENLFHVEEDHAGHDEDAWARRLRTALYFPAAVPSRHGGVVGHVNRLTRTPRAAGVAGVRSAHHRTASSVRLSACLPVPNRRAGCIAAG